MYINYNPNPFTARVGDCVVRAISKAENQTWEKTYIDVCIFGLITGNMPSGNNVWSRYLKYKGYKRHIVPDTCPDCYTVEKFEEDHPDGTYILVLDNHVVCVQSGNHFDTWDSANETVVFYWEKEE